MNKGNKGVWVEGTISPDPKPYCEKIIKENPEFIADFMLKYEVVLSVITDKTMRLSQGHVNPNDIKNVVNELLFKNE